MRTFAFISIVTSASATPRSRRGRQFLGLFEEFVFRGVLQQWLEQWTWNRAASLLLTSLIFGAVHLWFRNFPFPNWRWALIAAILGWFCGHARNQAGSIRASVVTHALVVATWRGFFA